MTARIQKGAKKAIPKKGRYNDHLLILYNDDVHSFDYVIENLIVICDHSSVQAEQCAMIAHYKGVCDIKKGELSELKNMQMALVEKGLKAEIN